MIRFSNRNGPMPCTGISTSPSFGAFLAVVETGGVTKAADLMNLSQGAISQQIKRLSSCRATRCSCAPAVAGSSRRTGVAVMAAATRIRRRQRSASGPRCGSRYFEGEVRFGAPYDIIGSYTPPILPPFPARRFRPSEWTLVCQDSVVLLSELRAGNIDLALTTELGCGKGGETLRNDRLVWVGARGGASASKGSVAAVDRGGRLRVSSIAIAALRKARREWLAVCEVSNMEPVRATLEADLAIAPLLSHARCRTASKSSARADICRGCRRSGSIFIRRRTRSRRCRRLPIMPDAVLPRARHSSSWFRRGPVSAPLDATP